MSFKQRVQSWLGIDRIGKTVFNISNQMRTSLDRDELRPLVVDIINNVSNKDLAHFTDQEYFIDQVIERIKRKQL